MERTFSYTARPGFSISRDEKSDRAVRKESSFVGIGEVVSPYYQVRCANVLLIRDGELASEMLAHESLPRCPLCHHQSIRAQEQRTFGLFPKQVLMCASCEATFTKSEQGYMLSSVRNKTDQTWLKYGRQTLALREWESIERGGVSDAEQKKIDIAQWFENLRNGKVEFNSNTDWGLLLPQGGERILYAFPNVTMKEPRSIRRSSGAYGGPSIRVMKGVSFRTGGFGSTSESHSEIRKVDEGTLTVTDRRIVFSGVMKTLNIEFSKIIEIEALAYGIALRRSTSQKTQYFMWPVSVATLSITINGKTYLEPLAGVMLKSLVEGLMHRTETP